MNRKSLVALALSVAGLSGCATVNPKQDFDRASRQIAQATGQEVAVDPTGERLTREQITLLLADGLTASEAVQLCLINNPRIQAELLRIGIGRAEFVQSGLFSNPSLALSLRFPDEGGLANFEVSLAQNIAELWQIKHRRKAAERDLDQTILKLAREASVLALDARSVYVRTIQADRNVELARENLGIAEQLVELANARRQAGSGTDVDVNLASAERVSLDVKARSAAVAAVTARADLGKLLGLTTPPSELALKDPLPDPQELSFDATQVIETSREHRLDLKAADAVIQAAQSRLEYERSRIFKNVELGISMERDERRSRGDRNWLADTAWSSAQAGAPTLPSLQPRDPVATDYVTGPTLSLELPLFDQNQAQVARAEYELLQVNFLKESIERDIVQDSWAAHTRVRVAFENAKFVRDELIPLREKGLALAREAFRVGNTTILTTLDAQRTLLEARTGYIQAQADAALATIELERISGLPFADLAASKDQTKTHNGEVEP